MINLKELKQLVKYLRKEGITEFKHEGLELKLGNQPAKLPRSKKIHPIPEGQVDVSEQVNIDSDYPTDEELLFWSAGGSTPTPEPKDS